MIGFQAKKKDQVYEIVFSCCKSSQSSSVIRYGSVKRYERTRKSFLVHRTIGTTTSSFLRRSTFRHHCRFVVAVEVQGVSIVASAAHVIDQIADQVTAISRQKEKMLVCFPRLVP